MNTYNLKDDIEHLNSISKDEYYIYQKISNESFPLIFEFKGPDKSPYEGGVFIIEMNDRKVNFVTKICSIFINESTGEFVDNYLIENYFENKASLKDIINYIKEQILVTPNDTKLIEDEIGNWPGKEVYYKYLQKIKSYTQKYANIDGTKIKVDFNLLSNQDFSDYKNNASICNKELQNFKRIKREINNETENISIAKSFLDIKLDNIYFCPYNNFKDIYFEFLGEPGTPYEGGVFKFLYEISKDYPFRPGKCIFRTKILHNKFKENASHICEYEIGTNYSPAWTLYHLCLYYYVMMNKYDYICGYNKRAKNLMLTNFKEYLKQVKDYVKNYSNNDGIKCSPNLKLIESPADALNIEAPIEKDFMPEVGIKEPDKNIKEEEINIISKNIFINDFMLKVLNNEFVVDICLKIRNYIIENKDLYKKDSIYQKLEDYKNLLPKILIPKNKVSNSKYMEYNKQIGFYDIKNDDKINFSFQFPTCSYDFNKNKNK